MTRICECCNDTLAVDALDDLVLEDGFEADDNLAPTSSRSADCARMMIGSISSPSRYNPTARPSKACIRTLLISWREMSNWLACCLSMIGRSTLTRPRQSLRTPKASGCVLMIASALAERPRRTFGSGPKNFAWILPGSPGPNMNLRTWPCASSKFSSRWS